MDTENKSPDKRFKVIIGRKKDYDPMTDGGPLIDTSFFLREELAKVRRKRRIKLVRSDIRFVMVFIENDAEQLWIPRRSLSDALFPGQLDVSIKRPVFSGENYRIAVVNFIRDEILCNPLSLGINFFGHDNPLDGIKTTVFTDVYRIRMNNVPEHYADRFSESGFFHPQELFNRLMSGDPATDDLKKLFLNLY